MVHISDMDRQYLSAARNSLDELDNEWERKKEDYGHDEYDRIGDLIKSIRSDLEDLYLDLEREYFREIKEDEVHNPSHYQGKGGLEVKDVIEAFLTPEQLEGWYRGNVIKYILRYPNKGGKQDLEKDGVYLNWLTDIFDKATTEDEQ